MFTEVAKTPIPLYKNVSGPKTTTTHWVKKYNKLIYVFNTFNILRLKVLYIYFF
jgi:hypothetical protein